MSVGQWVLVVTVIAAVGFGLWRAWSDGRFRGTHRVRHGAESEGHEPSVLDGTAIEHTLGERATLLQFSSAFCAPCRTTRRLLDEVAALVPGVEHVEVDAEHHLDLVRRLGVMRTPTTLVLDPHGREITRAQGVPTTPQVLAALGRV